MIETVIGFSVAFLFNLVLDFVRHRRDRNHTLRLEQKLWWMNYLDKLITLNDEFFSVDFEAHPEKAYELGGKLGIRLKASGMSEIDSKFNRLTNLSRGDIAGFRLLSQEIISEEVRRAAAKIRELESA